MAQPPVIVVQIIHIEGPEKGRIQELTDPQILIGRHPDCQVRFPAELKSVSRRHATITREGNRFKLTDTSSNGTIVNGKRITEVFLKDGDVLTMAQGGPKFSFLTKLGAAPAAPIPPLPQEATPPPPVRQPETPQPMPAAVAPPLPPCLLKNLHPIWNISPSSWPKSRPRPNSSKKRLKKERPGARRGWRRCSKISVWTMN